MPCGLENSAVTSLSEELGRASFYLSLICIRGAMTHALNFVEYVSVEDAVPDCVIHFGHVYGAEMVPLREMDSELDQELNDYK